MGTEWLADMPLDVCRVMLRTAFGLLHGDELPGSRIPTNIESLTLARHWRVLLAYSVGTDATDTIRLPVLEKRKILSTLFTE